MKTVCLGLTSSTVRTTSRKSGFSRNLVSLFVCTFVVMLAVRTVVGGAVWGGPGEKQELESYIWRFDNGAWRQEVLPGFILGSTSMLRPQLTLWLLRGRQVPRLTWKWVGETDSSGVAPSLHRGWWQQRVRSLEWRDFESLNPALSNIQLYSISLPDVPRPTSCKLRSWLTRVNSRRREVVSQALVC